MDARLALPPAAAALGISFSGRDFHYRQYTYDQLSDALAYARLDRTRPGFREAPQPAECAQRPGPTAEDRLHMAEHGIRYERGRYLYGPYRYDALAAALDYARHAPGLPCAAQQVAPEADEA